MEAETTLDELRQALELATEEELQQLTKVLFNRGLNPLDYWQAPDVLEVQSRDRDTWLDTLEQRFRYLAADGLTVLQGKEQNISYRHVLIRVCRYLKIPYSQQMTTLELESEIFLHLVNRAWKKLPRSEQKSLIVKIQKSLAESNGSEPLPPQIQHNPLDILVKGGSILAVNSFVRPLILKQIAYQFALHFARYQVAKTALVHGASQVQNYVVLQTAERGMAMAVARHGAVRTVFAFLGPLMWAALVADLGWKAIATNYGRIIPTIFSLAQIRLIRSECLEF